MMSKAIKYSSFYKKVILNFEEKINEQRKMLFYPYKQKKEIAETIDNYGILCWFLQAEDSALLYNSFQCLSFILETENLINEEIEDILFSIIEKNIKTGILNPSNVIKPLKRNCQIFKQTIENILKMFLLKGDFFPSYKESLNKKLAKANNKKNTLYVTNYSMTLKQNAEVIMNHRLLQEFYFNKQNNYDEKDINIIINALSNLGCSEYVISIIRTNLTEKWELRKLKEKIREVKKLEQAKQACIPTITKEVYQTPKELLTSEQKVLMFKELNHYFNFKKMRVIRPLNLNEIIECLRMAIKLKLKKSVTDEFLKIMNQCIQETIKDGLEKKNYYEPKIINYQTKYCLENLWQDATFYAEMAISTPENEKEDWKEALTIVMNEIISIIKNDYSYEYENAQKLTKEN